MGLVINMKYFFEFTVNKETEVEESVVEKREDGSEVTTKKKVKQNIPVKFFLRKPNRTLRDAADLHYHKKLHEGMRQGMLSSAGLSKIIENEDGILSEKDKDLKKVNYEKLLNSQGEYQRLASKSDKTEEETAKTVECEKSIAECLVILKEIERKESQLYQNTAEMYAQNKVLFWWTLVLGYYQDEAGVILPFFGDGDEKKRLEDYDSKEEQENPFYIEAINKLAHYTAVAFITSSFEQEKMIKALKVVEGIEAA